MTVKFKVNGNTAISIGVFVLSLYSERCNETVVVKEGLSPLTICSNVHCYCGLAVNACDSLVTQLLIVKQLQRLIGTKS